MAKVKKIDLYQQELQMYECNPSLAMASNGWTEKEYESKIQELEEAIVKSKRGKSSRNKGSSYERSIAKLFKYFLNVDLVRTPQSGGFAKKNNGADGFRGDIVPAREDVDMILHIECKDHSTWSLPQWLRQAEEDCPEGKIPTVIMHRRQKNKDGKRIQEAGDFIVLPLEYFLENVEVGGVFNFK